MQKKETEYVAKEPISLTLEQVKKICQQKFGSDSSRLTWLLESCDLFFQKPRSHGTGFGSKPGRGYKGNTGTGSLQMQRQFHREFLNSFISHINMGRLKLNDHDSLDKMTSRCRWHQGWEHEVESQKLKWPTIYDGIILERVVFPMKYETDSNNNKNRITFSPNQCTKIIQNISHKYKSNLQMHSKKSLPDNLKKEWAMLGSEMKAGVQEAYKSYNVKRKALWQPFKDNMDKFEKLKSWNDARYQFQSDLEKKKEQANTLEDQVVVQLFTILQQMKKNETDQNSESKKDQNSENSNDESSYLRLLKKCLASLKSAEDAFLPYLQDLLSESGGKMTLKSGMTDQRNEVKEITSNVWKLSSRQFTFYNPVANTKPQIISGNAPKSVPGDPVVYLENEFKKLKLDITSRCNTCRRTLTTMISNLEECKDKEEQQKLAESSAFLANAKKIRRNYSIFSMFEAVTRVLQNCDRSMNKYTCSMFRNTANALQKLDDFQAKAVQNEVLNAKRKDEINRCVEARVEYSWDLRYGTSLLVHCIAALIAPELPVVKRLFERPTNSSVNQNSNSTQSNITTTSANAKAKGVVLDGKVRNAKNTSIPAAAVAPTTGNIPQNKISVPDKKSGATLSYSAVAASPIVTAKQLQEQQEMYEKRIKEYEKALGEKDNDIQRLKQMNETNIMQLSSENETMKVELAKSHKEIVLLKDVLKKAQSELDAQRRIQLELSQVVKELQHARTATAVGYQPYVQPQAVMMVPTSSVVGYQQAGYQHMYSLAQPQNQNQSDTYTNSSAGNMDDPDKVHEMTGDDGKDGQMSHIYNQFGEEDGLKF